MSSIACLTAERIERVLAWARYLHWADLHRQHLDAWIEKPHDVDNKEDGWNFIALMSAWYASLWVVVEGWKELKLDDSSIDELLEAAPRYVELLRRYRNGVFHYQHRLIEPKLGDFLSEGESAVYWVHLLHEQFCRYYWALVESPDVPEPLHSEIRDSVIGIVGWIPNDFAEAQIESLRVTARQTVSMLREAGDFTSPAARDLLESTRQADDIAAETELSVQTWRDQTLDRIRPKGGSA